MPNDYTRADYNFVNNRLSILPEPLRDRALDSWMETHQNSKYQANITLLRASESVSGYRYRSDIDDVKADAEKNAKRCLSLMLKNEHLAYSRMFVITVEAKIDAPSIPRHGVSGALARMMCSQWWFRKLQVKHLRDIEHAAIKLGHVHQKAGKYISDPSLRLHRQRKRRTEMLIQQMVAVNKDTGDITPLQDIIDTTVSNPANRRTEMMVRISGLDQDAMEKGLSAVFYTLTCPSYQHARFKSSGAQNPKYDGDSPKKAHESLCGKWARTRALLSKQEVEIAGIRVVEPHHDGTPHWHMLVYTKKDNIPVVTWAIKKHFLYEDHPEEKNAHRARVKTEHIDPERGNGVGYVAKYVSKNIDGHGLEESEARESERVKAWASVWGVRQFQFFGSPLVTAWRELRKLKTEDIDCEWHEIVGICQQGDWLAYIKFAESNRIVLMTELQQKHGQYGDDVRKIRGVTVNGDSIETRSDLIEVEFFTTNTSEVVELQHSDLEFFQGLKASTGIK